MCVYAIGYDNSWVLWQEDWRRPNHTELSVPFLWQFWQSLVSESEYVSYYTLYIYIYLIYLLIYYKLKVATNGILSMFLIDHWKKTHLELLCLTRECTRIALPLYRRKTKARTNAGCELMGGGKHGKQALHCSIQCMMCYIFSIYHPQDLNCANIPALKLHAQNKTNFYLRAHTCEI